jgi:hypothetical protein
LVLDGYVRNRRQIPHTLLLLNSKRWNLHEITVVLDLMKAVIRKYLLAGFRVKTDLFNARLTVKGGFASEEDEYDPGRHTVRVRMAPAVTAW